jgi:iron complex transport system substrate-binding protein
MVAKAGGTDVLGRAGAPSYRVASEQIVASRPDVIVVMPCGYNLERTHAELSAMKIPPQWSDLPAVREWRIFAVDANSYFSRPGPRLAEGVALLARILHPDLFAQESASPRYRRM